jgi:hypothetical protein
MVQLLSCPNSDHRLVLGIHSRKDQGHPVDFFVQMRWHSRDEQQLQGEMPRLQVRQQRGRRGKQARPLKFKAVLFVIIIELLLLYYEVKRDFTSKHVHNYFTIIYQK